MLQHSPVCFEDVAFSMNLLFCDLGIYACIYIGPSASVGESVEIRQQSKEIAELSKIRVWLQLRLQGGDKEHGIEASAP